MTLAQVQPGTAPKPLAAAAARGLAVLLPGFGYGADKPLLYYARRAAQAAGYETLAVEYGLSGWDKSDLRRSVSETFAPALAAAAAQLAAARRGCPPERLLLVGKSFGTLVAGALAAQPELAGAKTVFFTPLGAALPYAGGHCLLAASGTADPYVSTAERAALGEALGARLLLFAGANHSLELPGKPLESLRILQQLTASLLGLLLPGAPSEPVWPGPRC